MHGRTVGWIVAGLVVAGAAALGYRAWQPATTTGQRPPGGFAIPIETAVAVERQLTEELIAVGSLRANESVTIRPEIAGRIAATHFKEGQTVSEGAMLVSLDDSIARAELQQSEANLTLSRRNYERADELYRKQSGTAQARDTALAKLHADEAAVALSRAQLAKTVVRAPFAGTVGLRQVSNGDYVGAGRDIVSLVNADPLKVDFKVPETRLREVAVGQRLAVELDAYPGRSFPGEVYAIEPSADPEGRSVALRARIPNPDGVLRPGLFARVRLMVKLRDSAVVVPEQAIVPQGDAQYVYRVIDGKAMLTPVTLGLRLAGEVELTAGVKPGETVVTAGQIKLRSGVPVQSLPPHGGAR